jgi:hypothetical protein
MTWIGRNDMRNLLGATVVSCSVLILGASPGVPHVSGTYDTRVTLLRSTCQMEVESNPTEVTQYADSTTITLRHAGTTYQGKLAADSSFRTQTKVLDFNGVRYEISIVGRFTPAGLSAEVTLRYGDPACTAVVQWEGPRRVTGQR